MNLSRIVRAFFSLSALTGLSRISGFVKVAAVAAFYGRSVEADMLTAVMILPDLVYKFLSEGLISGSAVPIFVRYQNEKKELHSAFWSIFWITTVIGILISVLLFVGTAGICNLLMPEINSNNELVLHRMWILLIPYLVLGLVGGVQTSLLNANLCFAKPAVGALLVNISIIIGIFVASGKNVEIIAVSNTIGAFVQVIWLFWLSFKNRLLLTGFYKVFVWNNKIVSEYVSSSAPVVAWISLLPLIPIYERHLLSANQGGIATLNYTEKLFNLPLGVISISLAHVILPNLSRLEGIERRKFLFNALGLASAIILPIIAVIWCGADWIVKLVYMRGKFSLEDATIASKFFKIYSVALLPVSLNMMINRGFFASGNYKIPFFAGLVGVLIQLYICYSYVPKYGLQGIAIATISAGLIQLLVLLGSQLGSKDKIENKEN